MNDQSQALVEQLTELMRTATEAQTREFILAHMQEFPADLQRTLAVGFFEDALTEHADAVDSLQKDREDAAKAVELFEEEAQA